MWELLRRGKLHRGPAAGHPCGWCLSCSQRGGWSPPHHCQPREGQGAAWPRSPLFPKFKGSLLAGAEQASRGFLGVEGRQPLLGAKGPAVRAPFARGPAGLRPKPWLWRLPATPGPKRAQASDMATWTQLRGKCRTRWGPQTGEGRRDRLRRDASWGRSHPPPPGPRAGRRQHRVTAHSRRHADGHTGRAGWGLRRTLGSPLTLLFPDGGLQTERGV